MLVEIVRKKRQEKKKRVEEEHAALMNNKGPGQNLALEDREKMKKAIVDIEYEGYTIPRGWKVLWTAYGTHYNPKYFGDPSTFDPSRFEDAVPPYVFVPFEGGPRVCAGYQLAKLNILIFLHFVVTHYDWSLRYLDEPITMDPLPFPFQEMPIKISPKPII
ncbi:hypothetical protein VitviT2T_017418 [Vitis vinifera]|uniref:Beta-amyrin 28-oxidase n=1 Tax=Vitis vinifera TaxID=29760 RepID=A0ABY9CUG5_VITVI|nr:hypothetical protein VitviT2T_017418 [Vitis vinifera]